MATIAASSDARVVIVDDHVSVAEALERALSAEGHDVRRVDVPDAPDASDRLVESILEHEPTVVLLNLDLGPFGDGVPLVARLAESDADVVVLTGQTDRVRWGEALARGARLVLSKARPLDDISATVRRLGDGESVLDPVEHERLVDAWEQQRSVHGQTQDRLDLLTGREREVLGELMRGRAVREIASRGVVSEATVRTQVKSILAKLGVSSQLAAVGLAHGVGWRSPEQVGDDPR